MAKEKIPPSPSTSKVKTESSSQVPTISQKIADNASSASSLFDEINPDIQPEPLKPVRKDSPPKIFKKKPPAPGVPAIEGKYIL